MQTGGELTSPSSTQVSSEVPGLHSLVPNRPAVFRKPSRSEGGGDQKGKDDKKGFFRFDNFCDDICRMFNFGKCFKPPGTCATKTGSPLRHVCNIRQDSSQPANVCGKDHPCTLNH